jgi:hypothetical protein
MHTNGYEATLSGRAGQLASLGAVALCLLAGCGGSVRSSAGTSRVSTSRSIDSVAKMRVVSRPGALPIVEKGTLVGNFDAQLTATLNHSGAAGAQSKRFDIHTAEGSITGVATLGSYTLGSPIVAEYPASISGGTGVFAHVSSNDLLFRTEASGLPGSPNPKITITVTGTLGY